MTRWTLGVSTACAPGALALLRDGSECGRRTLEGSRGSGLVPAARDLLAEAGIRPSDLSLVALDAGPGSFTGTRIAVAFAKSLAYAAGCALAPVSGLEARARACPKPGGLAVALDARRGRFHAAAFLRGGGILRRTLADGLFTPAELHAQLPEPVSWLGDAGAALARPGDAVLGETPPDPAVVAAMGEASSLRPSAFALAPAYLRQVEAQEKARPR